MTAGMTAVVIQLTFWLSWFAPLESILVVHVDWAGRLTLDFSKVRSG